MPDLRRCFRLVVPADYVVGLWMQFGNGGGSAVGIGGGDGGDGGKNGKTVTLLA